MGIEIQEAREKLDILERLSSEPQLIFTDLFSDDKNEYWSKQQDISNMWFMHWGLYFRIGKRVSIGNLRILVSKND